MPLSLQLKCIIVPVYRSGKSPLTQEIYYSPLPLRRRIEEGSRLRGWRAVLSRFFDMQRASPYLPARRAEDA